MTQIPLIPGDGVGNRLTLDDISSRLGRTVRQVDAGVVGEVLAAFAAEHQAVLGFDPRTFGCAKLSDLLRKTGRFEVFSEAGRLHKVRDKA